MFKIIKGLSPAYLQDLFSIRSTKYNLRDSEIKLTLPKEKTVLLQMVMQLTKSVDETSFVVGYVYVCRK